MDEQQPKSGPERSEGMIWIGIGLLLAGLTIVVVAFVSPTTVPIPLGATDALGHINIGDSPGVENTGLLQKQMLLFLSGAALSVIGAIFFAAGRVERVLGTRD